MSSNDNVEGATAAEEPVEKNEKSGKKKKDNFFVTFFRNFATTIPIFNKKVKGKAAIDQTNNNELWQKIVDNSLVGCGAVSKAAICSIETGGIRAYNPKDFTPTVEQVQYLAAVTEEPDKASETGIKVAAHHFLYKSGKENKALFGHGSPETDSPDDQMGVIVYKGQTNLLITVYELTNADTAKKTCADLFEYFVEEQNGF